VTFEATANWLDPSKELNRAICSKDANPSICREPCGLENAAGSYHEEERFQAWQSNRAMARRPAGTAFPPFVFAAAYEKGVFPGETVDDSCLDNRYVMVGGDSGILGEWGVEREENEYEGLIPAREALAKGKNAATVRLGLRIGLDQVKSLP
jgi:membrane peptidoglycan carboxypeptidase